MDQTRGILTYVEQNCPGRFHSSIEYVTVAGKYIEGAGLRDKGASIPQKIVGAGYQQVTCQATHTLIALVRSVNVKYKPSRAEGFCSVYQGVWGMMFLTQNTSLNIIVTVLVICADAACVRWKKCIGGLLLSI